MSDQLQFQRKLAELLKTAQSQNMRVTKEEIHRCFAEDGLNEEQMLLVYDYLLSQKVTVAGYLKNGEPAAAGGESDAGQRCFEGSDVGQSGSEGVAFGRTSAGVVLPEYTEEEREYLRDYEAGLRAMKPETPGERQALLAAAAQGDASAKSRLIELYLPVVAEIAKEMRREGYYIGDLVQEGNVSLLLALDMLTKMQDEAGETELADVLGDAAKFSEEANRFIREEIRQGILVMLEEQEEMKRRDHKMEQQVNDLDDALHRMADEKGRAVTLDELAEYVQMSTDEILDIMKLAGEDLYDKFKNEKE